MDASTTQQKIASLYIGFFERAPEQSGFNYWLGVAQSSGMSGLNLMKTIAAGFATHPSFDATYGGLGNAAFVDAIYVNVGGSPPDAQGRAFWVNKLEGGMARSEFVAEFCYWVLELDATELGNLNLTPQELADALARRAQLYNQIEVSLAYVTAMGAGSNFAPGTDPMNPASLALDPAYQAAVNILRGVTSDPASNDDELAYLAGNPTIAGINAIFGPPPGTGSNFILTPGQDILTGTGDNDTFFGTDATLNNGDRLDGAGGMDTLKFAVGANADPLVAPTLSNIELIEVNSPNANQPNIAIDLSNATGYEVLRSYQVTDFFRGPGLVAFYDIQNVNNTDLEIIDTHVDHEYSYDLNAYVTPAAGGPIDDIADLLLQEVRDSGITFYTEGVGQGPAVDPSLLDGIDLLSVNRFQTSNSYYNDVSSLSVGPNFRVLNIGGTAAAGSADLRIVDWLDPSIERIDADGATSADGQQIDALVADLVLSVRHDNSSVRPVLFTYQGALDDGTAPADPHDNFAGLAGWNDVFTLERTGNSVVTLNSGNDWLRARGVNNTTGAGNMTVSGGLGNDDVLMNMNGRHSIDLGAGNDVLEINGNVDDFNTSTANDGTTTIDAGTGNDDVQINGNGRYSVALGDGHDFFQVGSHPPQAYTGNYTIDGGSGNDQVLIWAVSGTVNATLGQGNDYLLTTAVGNQTVDGGDGDDVIGLLGNGNHRVTAGNDNDQVFIGDDGQLSMGAHGDFFVHGWHNVDLGEGNDYLLINGGRRDPASTDEDNSGGDQVTTIVGGGGNDTVDVRFDHYLNANLGAGDDRIILRARDLTGDDIVAGGAGRDTAQLTNQSYDEELVGQSETGSTTGIEVFDLRNANITLRLTADNFDTAENRAITVYTQEADRATLPANLVALGLAQGMSVADFTTVAQAFSGTRVLPSNTANDAVARQNLVNHLLNNGVEGVNFADTNSDGDSALFTSFVGAPISIQTPSGSTYIDAIDQMNFRLEPDGYMAVDITAVPLSLASGRTFTLDGGNIRDVVIADDDSINGRSTLRFDGPASANQSVQDTLYVVGQADIEAADLRNVTGLENIILSPNGSEPGVWEVVLTAPVVNQTTGSADLNVIVAPEVPAGSELRITLDPTVHTNANNDVVIKRNSNVTVYIDGVQVNEPDFGVTDYNTGVYSVTVVTQLLFTTNTDNLVGTGGGDEFVATSINQINSSDVANGLGGYDRAIFNFAVANPTATLRDQFENAAFLNIEEFVFNTGNNVQMNGLGIGYVPGLQRLVTGLGDDRLFNMRPGLEYSLGGGDDSISLGASGGPTTIDGGSGDDSVTGTTGDDYIRVRDVENIDVLAGNDRVDLLAPNAALVTVLNVETLFGSSGSDWVYADNNNGDILVDMFGGDDTLTVGGATPNNATVYGGVGNDDLTVYAAPPAGRAIVYGDDNGPGADGNDAIFVAAPNATVYGEGGNDEITVRSPASGENPAGVNVLVEGGSGNDTMDVAVRTNDGTTTGIVRGDAGNDLITFLGTMNFFVGVEQYTIEGGSGNDTVDVTTTVSDVAGAVGADRLWIDLGTGNDVATVTSATPSNPFVMGSTLDVVTVLGGSGDDSISLVATGARPGGQFFQLYDVEGGSGNDTFNIGPNSSAGFAWMGSVEGGLGNDTINLNADARGGHDTVIFGNIAYSALQVISNTQGVDTITNFQFEAALPGDPAPAREDTMNFAGFLGTAAIDVDNLVTVAGTYAGGTVDANDEAGNSIVVLSSPGLTLTAANFSTAVAGTIQINDNGRGVVVVGQDETGPGSGIQNFDIWFVQDIDTGVGSQTWAVDFVGTVAGVTRVGVGAVIDNLLDGLTLATDDGPDVLPGFIGNQTYDMTGDDIEVFFNAVEWAWNSGSDVLQNFECGLGDDEVNFDNWYVSLTGREQGGGGFASAITPFTTADAGNVNLNGLMALFNAGAGNLGFVDTALEIAQLFGAGVPGLANSGDEFTMGVGGSGVLLTGAAGSPTVYMWDIDDRDGDGTVDIPEVTLIGTFQLDPASATPDITGFHADNFNF